jgi:Mrp family chromosome partitioning ATPase/capsular polysaccharide biosynthesis protein
MNETTTDVASIFAPLWRRKWLILAVAILVGAGTYEYYKRKPGVYTARTQLYLGGASEQQAAVGSSPVKSTLTGRALTDQVEIINSSVIGIPVHKRLREEHLLAAARGKVKATPSGTSDFIVIATEASTPKAATTLANAYAQAYITRQRANYLHNVKTAITNTRDQLRRIEPGPSTKGKGSKGAISSSAALQAASLESKINQLEATLSSFSGVQQVSPAKAAPVPISPTPKKNAIFGFFLGLILAAVAAYALTRFDRRTRTLGEVEEIFGTQVLSALPKVGQPVVRPGGKRGPAKSLVEPLRRLQTVLSMGDMLEGNREKGPRVILFLSADAGDGRSTLIANLARVQADGDERVAIVEADFRRPTQAHLLDVSGPNGLAQVLSGRVDAGVAMQRVSLSSDPAARGGAESAGSDGGAGAVESSARGSVSVLLGGGPVANPPALLGGDAMAELLRSLADDFDYVLIDAPPPLEVSDVMPLLHLVDGLIIVARIGHTRDVSAQRLAQLLQRTASAPVLGVVANCVPRKDIERYGFSWVPMEQRRRKLIRR